MFLRRIAVGAVCWVLFASAPAVACNFRESATPTIRDEAENSFVLLGHIENVRGTETDGQTDFVISKVLKSDPALAGKKVITIPRLLPIPDPKNPPRFLVFGDVRDGKIDLYKGRPATPALGEYVEGLLKIDAKDHVKLMRYAFDFLEHKDAEASADAYAVFIGSADSDIRKVGQTLAPEKLRKWLRDKDTREERLRLYGYLLGNCGNRDDATLLRKLLERLAKEEHPTQPDGILVGYTLLDPKAGWAYTCDLAKEHTDFLVRYSALRAARYFRTTQPEVLTEADLLRVVKFALGDPDTADFAVDDLRTWKCWKLTDEVLALATKEKFNAPIIHRNVLKYALQCPGEKAAKFVAEQRKKDPQRVEQVEEWLKDEAASQPRSKK